MENSPLMIDNVTASLERIHKIVDYISVFAKDPSNPLADIIENNYVVHCLNGNKITITKEDFESIRQELYCTAGEWPISIWRFK